MIESDMQEIPGGENYGRAANTDPEREGRTHPLDSVSHQTVEFMREGAGFGIVEAGRGSGRTGSTYGGKDAGMTVHRGVLKGDEYIDVTVLRGMAEESLGYTYEEVFSVYRQGPLAAEQRQLREKIDARLLALSRDRGNMAVLAKVLGLNEKTIDRALRRAREAAIEPVVKRPAVVTDRMCFKCARRGARPRKRRYSMSFLRSDDGERVEDRRGTIDLCDACYARGFEERPGSAAYWEFKDRTAPVGV